MHSFLLPYADAQQTVRPIEMVSEYKNESVRKVEPVHYFSDSELATYQVSIVDGKLVNSKGKPLSSYLHVASIYVITADGELFVSPYSKHGLIHHSSLSRGKPTFAAGELIVEEGELKAIDLQSGHYLQSAEHLGYLKLFLSNHAVDISKVIIGIAAVKENRHLLKVSCDRFLIN